MDVSLKGYNRIYQNGTNVSNNKFPKVPEDVIQKHPEGGVFKVLKPSIEMFFFNLIMNS